jgi:hypothetical protein
MDYTRPVRSEPSGRPPANRPEPGPKVSGQACPGPWGPATPGPGVRCCCARVRGGRGGHGGRRRRRAGGLAALRSGLPADTSPGGGGAAARRSRTLRGAAAAAVDGDSGVTARWRARRARLGGPRPRPRAFGSRLRVRRRGGGVGGGLVAAPRLRASVPPPLACRGDSKSTGAVHLSHGSR